MMVSTFYVTDSRQTRSVPAGVSVTDVMLLCMALLWGVNFIVVKYATGVFAPLAFNTARILLAVLVLWSIVLVRGQPLPRGRDAFGMLALGMLGNGLYQILFIEGLARTRVSDAALLIAAAPAFIAVIGWLRGLERTGTKGILGIGLSLLGIGLVVSGVTHGVPGDSTLLGNGLLLGATLCWAGYSVLLKPFTERVDGITLSAVTMTGGLIPILVVAAPALAATEWSAVDVRGWGAVGYSGLLALVVAYLFWYRGLRVLGPTRTAMYANLQPLFTMSIAWAVLGEAPHAPQIAGALCIMSGLLLTRLPGRAAVVAHE